MPTQMKILSSDSTGQLFASPTKPSQQVRFKSTSAPKKLGAIQTSNIIREIILTDVNPVTVGSNTADDAISIRIRVSGSPLSEAALVARLNALGVKLPVWGTENVLVGFPPVTPPDVV